MGTLSMEAVLAEATMPEAALEVHPEVHLEAALERRGT